MPVVLCVNVPIATSKRMLMTSVMTGKAVGLIIILTTGSVLGDQLPVPDKDIITVWSQ